MHDEDALAIQLEASVDTVIGKPAAALASPARKRHRIAQVVAMDDVQRQADRERGAQRLSADYIAAMNDRLGAHLLRALHRERERVGAVVAVGDDADFQRTSGRGSGLTKPLRLGICTAA